MRYLDWDVLLFPSTEKGTNTNAAGAEAAHIPFREFKTECQTELLRTNGDPVPLLSTFVPSLPAGMHFQISVHSWTRTPPVLLPGPDGHVPRELWEVRVVVDGKVETLARLGVEGPWPQIISTANQHDGHELEEGQPLRFPRFHSALQNERGWCASDGWGRIRVELASGILDEKHGGFLKLADIVTFAFQHAPLQILESAGIAWPSHEMYRNPLPRQSPQMKSNVHRFGEAPSHGAHHPHRKMPSMGILQHPMMDDGQQFNGPVRHLQDYNTIDPSSRSTSAYSTLSASAGPIISPTFNGQALQQHVNVQGNGRRDGQYQFRLPSDQLAQIINALGASKQPPQTQHATNMPPPPVPTHATQFENGIDGPPIGHLVPLSHKNQRSETDQHAINAFDRRAASNSGYSDVSMHANCNNFPHCITEDPNGCLVHDNTAAPALMLRSKKEGSSPTKPRDFFSVTLDGAPAASTAPAPQSQPMTVAPKDMMTNTRQSPIKESIPYLSSSRGLMSSSPAEANGRKRTRSALKALNINDGGSPQKNGATDKPARKASRASVSSIKSSGATSLQGNENDKENVGDAFLVDHAPGALESQEESMALDA